MTTEQIQRLEEIKNMTEELIELDTPTPNIYKKYEDLTDDEESKVVEYLTNELLQDIVEVGPNIFGDKETRDKAQKAFDKADKMQTPWFVHEYVRAYMGEEIKEMALSEAKECLYQIEPSEQRIIPLYEVMAKE